MFFQRDLIRRASGRHWAIPYSSRDDDFAFKSIPSRIRVSSLKKMQRVFHKLFSQKEIKIFCGYTPIKMKRVEIGSKKHGTKEYNRNNF